MSYRSALLLIAVMCVWIKWVGAESVPENAVSALDGTPEKERSLSNREILEILDKALEAQGNKAAPGSPNSRPVQDQKASGEKRSYTGRGCRFRSALLCQSLYTSQLRRGLPEEGTQRELVAEGDSILEKRSSTSRCRYKNAFLCQSIYSMGNKRGMETPQQIEQPQLEKLLLQLELEIKREEFAELLQDLHDLPEVA